MRDDCATIRGDTGFVAGVVCPRDTLVRALAPNGRLIGIHSMGNDPGMEIVDAIWPGQNPFTVSRQEILEAVKVELGDDAAHYQFSAGSNIDSLFNYEMHTLPNEIDSSIATPGEHTIEALGDWGFESPEIAVLRESGAIGRRDND